MDLRVCSIHEPMRDVSHFLTHGTIVEFPKELCVHLGCDATRFQQGLVYTHLSPLVETPAYLHGTGLCVFAHPDLHKTCQFRFATEHVRSEGKTTCITRVFNLEWQDDDDFVTFLANLECRVKVHPTSWRVFVKEEREYAAFPHADLGRLTPYIKHRLAGVDAVFHHTVAFGATTYRCLLVPLAHLNTTVLPPKIDPSLWVAWKMVPDMHLHNLSDAAAKELGPPPPNVSLETLLQLWFDPHELVRIRADVLPALRVLPDNTETECDVQCRNGGAYRVHCSKLRTQLLMVFTRI